MRDAGAPVRGQARAADRAADAPAAVDAPAAAAALLAWYGRHARALPWRVGPAARQAGVAPDPYRVWLSEVMLQQTTVAAAEGHFRRFAGRWPDVRALAAAPEAEVMAAWAGLGYYARARNLIACARQVAAAHGGCFPAEEAALGALPGIGPYTAAAVAAIAFDRPAVVVDGNVERVVARLFCVATPLPAAKPRLRALAATLTPAVRPGDHAQAMMDLGATVCTPRRPDCGACPLAPYCAARAAGRAAELPARAPRRAAPLRRGLAYVARRADGAVLLERRPARGLLGGMAGWPGSVWAEGPPPAHAPPVAADWRPAGEVDHVFTHFRLRLEVLAAEVGAQAAPARGAFVSAADFAPSSLPTLMRKVWDRARPALDGGA
jgi:A/G-specific adenine glycosylase